MFSRIKNFVCRHKKKFIVSGVIVGGSILLTRYAHKKFIEWQDKETRDFLERTRKGYQFENAERTSNLTILALANQLKVEISKILDSESLLIKLRTVDKDEKLGLWQELKIITIARHAALMYCGLMLTLVIRVQLNIMAGSMARDVNNKTEPSVQEKYLSLCQHFVQTGYVEVCKLVERHVRNICKGISLKSKMTLNDVEHMFWSIQADISEDEFNPLGNLSKYLFSRTKATELDDLPEEVKFLFTRTLLTLADNRIPSVAESCVGRAFTNCIDTLAEYFVNHQENEKSLTEPSTSNGILRQKNQLIHPTDVNIPVAKIVPIIHGLANARSNNGEADTWIYQYLIMDKINLFSEEVFNSFANIPK